MPTRTARTVWNGGLEDGTFAKIAQDAKAGCPVSKALAGTDISLTVNPG